MAKDDFIIDTLGSCNVKSPIIMSNTLGDGIANYVTDDQFVRVDTAAKPGHQASIDRGQLLECAGPREMLFFSPARVHAGIVTCGGLCPGLNNVIRAVVRCLSLRYGVRRISGFRYGYLGFLSNSPGEFAYGFHEKALTPELIDHIHKLGGTYLGSARGGGRQVEEIVDTMEQVNLNMCFVIGGDGTQRGTRDIADEIAKRKLKIAMVGIPKTVDNDFSIIQKSFGFDTAVDMAVEAVSAAHAEAQSAVNGIGLVKVMGRESGFIAAHTALASHDVNFVLIPEVPFNLEGYNGFLHHLEERLKRSRHAVIVVAEGAMQDQLLKEIKHDAGGNVKMADVGAYLKDRIQEHFSEKKIEINLKYIDPSYIIRSAKANPADSIYCERLGNAAVHAAMAGKTKLIIGLVNNEFVHIPVEAVIAKRNHVDPESNLWRDTLDATNQPIRMINTFNDAEEPPKQ